MRLTRVTLFFVVLITSLGFYQLTRYLLEDLEAQTLQATEETMVDAAHILAGIVEASPSLAEHPLESSFQKTNSHDFEAKIYNHLKTKNGLNAYLADASGTIIFDSARPDQVGQSVSGFREFTLTQKGKYGARSSRLDESDPNSSVMFVAAPVMKNDDLIGVLSVYKKQSDVFPFIKDRRRSILVACILIGLGILALIAAVFVWLFRPVGQLTDYARALTRGERRPKPEVGLGREVNTLCDSLHELHEELSGRQYIEQYAQTLTHELKSPLAAIQGAAEILEEDLPAEKRDHFLANIQNETKRAENLIHRLLQLAAVENQKHLKDTSDFDLTEVIQKAIADTTGLSEASKITIETTLPDSLSYHGNDRLLRSAIINLLENAIQFSPKNSTVKLTLTTEKDQHLIRIIDEGPGVPDCARGRAFERFYSYRHEASVAPKGNGLGLSFVREVAHLHHGEVSLTNNPEKGATATITLPA